MKDIVAHISYYIINSLSFLSLDLLFKNFKKSRFFKRNENRDERKNRQGYRKYTIKAKKPVHICSDGGHLVRLLGHPEN